jgi:hypothetical protein
MKNDTVKKIHILLPLIIVTFGFLLSLRQIDNYDIWWHLKVGETIVNTGEIILNEIYSHTMIGTVWIPHEWLSEVLFYLIYRSEGISGLCVFTSIIIALSALLIWLRGQSMRSNIWVLAGLIIWALLTARFRFMVRPHIFLLLMSSGLLYLLEQHERTGRRLFIWITVPWFLLWVNIHGSFPLGYAFIVFWSANSFLKTRSKFSVAILFLATAVMFLNPGFESTIVSIKNLFLSTTVSRSVMNEEFLPPTWAGRKLFWFFLGFSIVTVIFTVRKVRISLLEAAALGITAVLALNGVRYIAIFVFVATPYIALRSSILWNALTDRKILLQISALHGHILAFCIVVSLMVFGFVDAYGKSKAYRWGIGLDERSVPIKAADFLASTDLQDIRLYNSKRFGGYLTWKLFPEFRVAQDGRDEVFETFNSSLNVNSSSEYLEVMKAYRFQVAILGFQAENQFERYLRGDPYWVLVHWNDLALVYARRGEVPDEFINRWAYKYFSPFSLDYSYLAEEIRKGNGEGVIAELERSIMDNPNSFKPWVYSGFVNELMKNYLESSEAYEKALIINYASRRGSRSSSLCSDPV